MKICGHLWEVIRCSRLYQIKPMKPRLTLPCNSYYSRITDFGNLFTSKTNLFVNNKNAVGLFMIDLRMCLVKAKHKISRLITWKEPRRRNNNIFLSICPKHVVKQLLFSCTILSPKYIIHAG